MFASSTSFMLAVIMLVENIAEQSPNRICLNLIKALATIWLGWYVRVNNRPKGHGLFAAHYAFAFTCFHIVLMYSIKKTAIKHNKNYSLVKPDLQLERALIRHAAIVERLCAYAQLPAL